MSYRIIYAITATQDLKEIGARIAKRAHNLDIAKKFINELRETCKLLEVYPERGALPKDRLLKNVGFRFITHGDYLIVYYVDKELQIVYITTIVNTKQDYIRILRDSL